MLCLMMAFDWLLSNSRDGAVFLVEKTYAVTGQDLGGFEDRK
jgi:hypothetical protein